MSPKAKLSHGSYCLGEFWRSLAWAKATENASRKHSVSFAGIPDEIQAFYRKVSVFFEEVAASGWHNTAQEGTPEYTFVSNWYTWFYSTYPDWRASCEYGFGFGVGDLVPWPLGTLGDRTLAARECALKYAGEIAEAFNGFVARFRSLGGKTTTTEFKPTKGLFGEIGEAVSSIGKTAASIVEYGLYGLGAYLVLQAVKK